MKGYKTMAQNEAQAILDELGISVEDTLQVKVQVLYRGNEVDSVDMTTLARQTPEIQEVVVEAIIDQFGKIIANIQDKWPAALASEAEEGARV